MISERLNIIESILGGSSSKLREFYFEKNFNDTYIQIHKFTLNLEVPFVQKIWHWVNNHPTEFLCKCGNKTTFNRNWRDGYRKYCSPKCAQKDESTKLKRRETSIKKWGVENVAQSDKVKLKMEKTNMEKWGHKSTFQNSEVRKKWFENVKKKWGVDHVFQDESVKNKIRESNISKFGKPSYTQTEEYLEKTKETNLKKWGSQWYTQTENWIQKSKLTNNQKWGKDWYQQTDEFKEIMVENRESMISKSKETSREKWGVDWYSQTQEFKDHIESLNIDYSEIQRKSRQTNLEKWGVEYYPQTEDWRERTIQKNLEKFGKKWYSETEEWKCIMKTLYSGRLSEIQKNKSVQMCKDLGFDLVESKDGDFRLVSGECGHEFDIKSDTFYRRNFYYGTNPCTICNPIEKSQSYAETQIVEWIRSLGFKVEEKNRTICGGYEIDILIDSKKLAIEFNGLYWHSEKYKDKNYHLNKTLLCKESGIDLIHIWEDDWELRGEIIKSIISNRLGVTDRRLYARDCVVKECDNQTTSEFLNKNHIQGYNKFSKSLGLYLGGELVSLMTFGFRSTNGKREYELIRFCNKISTLVIGSASKIFSHFMRNNPDIDTIISYADRSLFSGKLYKELGFDYIRHSGPNYWWVVNGVRRHRFSFNKKKLVSRGYDPLKTEVQIMTELGHFRIWGSGQDRWVWSKK